MTRRRAVLGLLAVLVLGAAVFVVAVVLPARRSSCSLCLEIKVTPGQDSTTAPTSPTSPTTSAPAIAAKATLTEILRLDEPVAVTVLPDTGALIFAEKKGRVVAFVEDQARTTTVLDLRGQVSLGSEQGLLGVAVAPDQHHIYVDLTNRQGDTEIREYGLSGVSSDPTTERLVLKIAQPFANHNGGQVTFGPDGFLYIGMGDGGGAGDSQGNAQNLGSLLGKMLRIDPRPGPHGAYRPAPGNPYIGRAGARPEIWASGLRNPWRFFFDPADDQLWIADVGQGEWEEIDRVTAGWAGRNYGWNLVEGRHRFRGERPDGATDPIYEFDHSQGRCAVVGGVVDLNPGVTQRWYLFADYCQGRILGLHGDPIAVTDLGAVDQPTSFGLDGKGRVIVLSQAGPVYRLATAAA